MSIELVEPEMYCIVYSTKNEASGNPTYCSKRQQLHMVQQEAVCIATMCNRFMVDMCMCFFFAHNFFTIIDLVEAQDMTLVVSDEGLVHTMSLLRDLDNCIVS